MSDEKKFLSRRSFLKGAAKTGIVAAAAGTGLFVKDLGAQVRLKQSKMTFSRKIIEPRGVKTDSDVVPLAQSLGKASLEAAYDAFNAAAEQFVKGKARSTHTGKLLEAQGLKLRSSEAKAAAKSFNVPASILKVRELQLKQKGWHSHCSWRASAFCCSCNCHWHVSW
jgi:hypothetical protein